jgi:hypothetical protein
MVPVGEKWSSEVPVAHMYFIYSNLNSSYFRFIGKITN